ncbi:class I SAM-dependent methyltransferase [Candidatus Roizmanbacteria bacterium]|nr:class I SAM-dependent methyltransferase [Candidatus Roizmanbacteria bacterium]
MVSNLTIKQWDKQADLYDELQGEKGDVSHQLLFDPAIEKMLGDVAHKTILDAGCGNGYWSRRLAKKAKKVIAIDSSVRLIEIAKAKNNQANIEYQIMTLGEALKFGDKTFDLILSSMVLHYVPNLNTVASEFNRILKTRSKVIICVQHPLYQYHFRAQEIAGKKNNYFPKTVGYFDRIQLKQVTLFGKAILDIHNRPMEDYLRPFFKSGFALTDFSEPEFTKELLDKNPRYQALKEIPRVLIFQFIKLN